MPNPQEKQDGERITTERLLDEAFKCWSMRQSLQSRADRLVDFAGSSRRGLFFSETEEANLREIIAKEGWLKIARTAMNLSGNEGSYKRGVSRKSYFRAEEREREGRVTLATMKRYAEAIGCEFVYYIRPQERKTFKEAVWDRLVENSYTRTRLPPVAYDKSPTQKARVMMGKLQNEMERYGLRCELNWTERRKRSL